MTTKHPKQKHKRHPHHKPATHQYDPNVINQIINIAHQRKLSDDYILTALMVGITESGLQNLDHGDGTSVGWRQETRSSYGSVANRMDVSASVNRFYTELSGFKHNGTLGHWGQKAQRSNYPDRYDANLAEAQRILAQYTKK